MAGISAEWLRRLPAQSGSAPLSNLDAGCGTGGGLDWLAAFGSAHGVDLHPAAIRLAGALHRGRLAQADVRALPFPANSFDLLRSFDVLYQLQPTSDVTALREFSRVLKPGGWLLLRLPAYDWLRSAHDRCVQTKYRYSKPELVGKLRGVGLQPVRLSHANGLLIVPALLWRLCQRNQPAASDVRTLPGALNKALKFCLGVESIWLRHYNLPFGLSLLALAQKEPT